MVLRWPLPTQLRHTSTSQPRKEARGHSHATTALIKPIVEASSASFRKLRFDAGCYTPAAAATAAARSLMRARQRCLTGNGGPRAAWPFSSFEGACRNFSGRHKLLLGTRGADLSTVVLQLYVRRTLAYIRLQSSVNHTQRAHGPPFVHPCLHVPCDEAVGLVSRVPQYKDDALTGSGRPDAASHS